jgi:hypothetical protein
MENSVGNRALKASSSRKQRLPTHVKIPPSYNNFHPMSAQGLVIEHVSRIAKRLLINYIRVMHFRPAHTSPAISAYHHNSGKPMVLRDPQSPTHSDTRDQGNDKRASLNGRVAPFAKLPCHVVCIYIPCDTGTIASPIRRHKAGQIGG